MNEPYDSNERNHDPDQRNRITQARESFSGRMLTDTQFEDAMAVTGIIEREIRTTGKFKEKLGDYAVAMARTERFDAMKSETIIRDLFKTRTGQSMNQMREELIERENTLTDEQRRSAYPHAKDIGRMIEQGDKMPFYRAYAHKATDLADELGITDASAKTLMKEEFKAQENRELYDWGKEYEEKYYRPQIEAEKQQREAQRSNTQGRSRSRS